MSETIPGQPGAQPRRPTAVRRIPLFVRVVFVVAFAFTTLGVVESAFIVYDLFTGSLSEHRAPDLGFGIRSWTVHHAMRPGYSSPNVNTNAFGLRSPEVVVPKPAGTFRILLLGDSFTFGLGVSDGVVFARRMEQRLRKDYGFPSVEVVNAGVLSYCPLLEYLQYRHHLHVLDPDLVVLNFDMSDVQDHLEVLEGRCFLERRCTAFRDRAIVEEFAERDARTAVVPVGGAAHHRRETATRVRRRGRAVCAGSDRYLWALDNGPEMDREAQAVAPDCQSVGITQGQQHSFAAGDLSAALAGLHRCNAASADPRAVWNWDEYGSSERSAVPDARERLPRTMAFRSSTRPRRSGRIPNQPVCSSRATSTSALAVTNFTPRCWPATSLNTRSPRLVPTQRRCIDPNSFTRPLSSFHLILAAPVGASAVVVPAGCGRISRAGKSASLVPTAAPAATTQLVSSTSDHGMHRCC